MINKIILKQFIKEELLKNHLKVSKPFDSSLFDDEGFESNSVYVQNDIKDSILAWSKKMMLR